MQALVNFSRPCLALLDEVADQLLVSFALNHVGGAIELLESDDGESVGRQERTSAGRGEP